MIAKQFLITGMVWAILGGLMSVLFRLQLGYPDAKFAFLEDLLEGADTRRRAAKLNITPRRPRSYPN